MQVAGSAATGAVAGGSIAMTQSPQYHPYTSAAGSDAVDHNAAVTCNLPEPLCTSPGHNGGPALATTEPPRRRGRPSKSTLEIRERILEQLSEGKPVRQICVAPDMPSAETIRCWRRADTEFARQFDGAQEFGWQLLADDLFEKVMVACRTGNVARARLIFNIGRRHLARQAPCFFGGGW